MPRETDQDRHIIHGFKNTVWTPEILTLHARPTKVYSITTHLMDPESREGNQNPSKEVGVALGVVKAMFPNED